MRSGLRSYRAEWVFSPPRYLYHLLGEPPEIPDPPDPANWFDHLFSFGWEKAMRSRAKKRQLHSRQIYDDVSDLACALDEAGAEYKIWVTQLSGGFMPIEETAIETDGYSAMQDMVASGPVLPSKPVQAWPRRERKRR